MKSFDAVGSSASEKRFVVRAAERTTYSLRGRLVDGGGSGVANAKVQLRQGRMPVVPEGGAVRTDATGAFEVAALPAGRYRVSADAPQLVFLPKRIEIGSADHDLGVIRGAPPAQLTIELVGAAAAIAGVRAVLRRPEFERRGRGREAERRFERMFSGRYDLVVTMGDRIVHEGAIELRPADERSLRVAIE